MSSQPLTAHLLTLTPHQFTHATQSPFLTLAATGTLPKPLLSHWLANDRLYMQGYIQLAGALLQILRMPAKPTPSAAAGPVEVRLVDWLVDALVNIRREERFFMRVAEGYGLDVDLTGESGGVVDEGRKIEGLKRFEVLFGELTRRTGEAPERVLPWLEGVVLFWGTEKVYFEAWNWAKRNAEGGVERSFEMDEDGGAVRKEFIPNWTNAEFGGFVERLEGILNEGVGEAVAGDEGLRGEVEERAGRVWRELLGAEGAFWPVVEGV